MKPWKLSKSLQPCHSSGEASKAKAAPAVSAPTAPIGRPIQRACSVSLPPPLLHSADEEQLCAGRSTSFARSRQWVSHIDGGCDCDLPDVDACQPAQPAASPPYDFEDAAITCLEKIARSKKRNSQALSDAARGNRRGRRLFGTATARAGCLRPAETARRKPRSVARSSGHCSTSKKIRIFCRHRIFCGCFTT